MRKELAQARSQLPRHIAVLCDGNRRWARDAGFDDVSYGYRKGAAKIAEMLRWCQAAGIELTTVYLLSTENLQRDPDELSALIEIITDVVEEICAPANRWSVRTVGDLELLGEEPARRLRRQPTLMLLDEPFSALDTGLRAATRKAVTKVLTDAGVTTLLVTHDQGEALSVADQVAVMRAGRFTCVGTPHQVYRRPADRFTAEFLGDCVFLACTVQSGTAETALGRIGLTAPAADGPGTLMLRPEQLVATESTDAASGPEPGIGTVLGTEFLGHDVLLTIDIGGDTAPITVRQHSIDPPDVHTKVDISVLGGGLVLR
ncbi:hypothetical protein BV510_25450 [Mycolicibacterium diernhoferi]|uniref:ABC transporter domain-containing protein n=1 Tax=Mycolicibacterium diernhoferi TaxID=1801 RepID=A0A1T3VYN9_9MYCO|nr:hypothetical protein BV510_25450 [Mycolicibacterium diernhoferi]